jgi:hypothetical protein
MALSLNLRSPGVGLLHPGERLIGQWDRRPGLSPMQDQRFSLALELESFKAHHHHGVGFPVDEKDVANHRRAQASLDLGVAMLHDVGIPPCPVQRLFGRLHGASIACTSRYGTFKAGPDEYMLPSGWQKIPTSREDAPATKLIHTGLRGA